MKEKNEWTQTEYLVNKTELEEQGINVYLIDTILNPIEGADTMTYNPVALKDAPKGSYFIFYCDTGKASLERLDEYRKKFPEQTCISLRGGRGYWRPYLRAETLTKTP
ncbi:MAG: hypothetical protein OEW60_01275 [Thiovulaceae bacterium]|nr:hypothetical protein [Sulfurimonadaceae bacterium]